MQCGHDDIKRFLSQALHSGADASEVNLAELAIHVRRHTSLAELFRMATPFIALRFERAVACYVDLLVVQG